MVKARIIGRPARNGDNVVGRIRFISEDGKTLGEYPFKEKLVDVAGLSTKEFEVHALRKIRVKLKAAKLEEDWAKVQAVLRPLVVEAEE